MKKYQAIVLSLLFAGGMFANEKLSDADQKWSAAAEKMIAAGPATLSTPSEKRVEIARQLAKKAGRKAEVSKNDKGFRIVIQ